MAIDESLNTSLLGLTKQRCFYFAVCFYLCKCMPLASILIPFSSINSPPQTLSPCFFSPSHDCQFPQCQQHQKVKVLESFVNSCIFCISKGCLVRDFISTFVFVSSTPLPFFEFCLNFLSLLSLQQDLLLDLLPTQKEVLFFP